MIKTSLRYLPGLFILAAAVFVIVQCERPGQDAAISVSEGTIPSTGEVELYYRIAGTGPDTLVVLHGGPGMSTSYLSPDLKPLAESHTVIFYDQRGSGRSTIVTDPGSLHIDRYIEDLEAVRQYFGIEQLTLLGHSWGALLASRYALEHPEHVSNLVLASPGPVRMDPL